MQSRGRVIRVLLIVVALLATAGGLLWWEGARPGRVRVVATPQDAVVQIGDNEGVGTLDVELPPGRYTVILRAPGHLPLDMQLDVQARTELELTPTLLKVRTPVRSP